MPALVATPATIAVAGLYTFSVTSCSDVPHGALTSAYFVVLAAATAISIFTPTATPAPSAAPVART